MTSITPEKQILKGTLKNVGSGTCLDMENKKQDDEDDDDEDDNVPIVLTSGGIIIEILPIGKESNPVCILHRDEDGNSRVLDFSDTETPFFTTLYGSTYPKNQQFVTEKLGETFKIKQTVGTGYLSVEKSDSVKERLVLRPMQTDKEKIACQEWILLSKKVPEKLPIITGASSTKLPTITDANSAKIPIITDANSPKIPTITDANSAKIPIKTDANSPKIPTITDANSAKIPIKTDANSAKIPIITVANSSNTNNTNTTKP